MKAHRFMPYCAHSQRFRNYNGFNGFPKIFLELLNNEDKLSNSENVEDFGKGLLKLFSSKK